MGGPEPSTLDPDTYVKNLCDALAGLSTGQIRAVGDRLAAAWARGATVFVVGNGGSAATAAHMACDLSKSTAVEGGPGLRAVPLLDTAVLTAWANDTSYEEVFAAQLRTLASPGDVLVVISASGNSPNILKALAAARACAVESIALLGFEGGAAALRADHTITAYVHHYGLAEDVHLAINHMLTDYLKTLGAVYAPHRRTAAVPGTEGGGHRGPVG
ncbi:MAG TPA: SIS domain-containing protein [Streptomyces sp.]|uniref:D-sedoheptulose-7-phosphate isomerase n=1 Tax=Streptomyces sp. TaxID=1931 RepID=UPI002D4AF922|nr:SIS domain-containing protein [Streptomyces sp.]HZG04295.1 SIS domain-containing protein [Streptomyces sp.]